MLSLENSKYLTKLKQKAIYYKNIEMIKKIEKIKNDNEITDEIKNYSKSV